jgi:hypothetical protein
VYVWFLWLLDLNLEIQNLQVTHSSLFFSSSAGTDGLVLARAFSKSFCVINILVVLDVATGENKLSAVVTFAVVLCSLNLFLICLTYKITNKH